ncbi:MAG: DUF2510 domain-containing protein [Actinomycetota bacterium]|nr:DUF2510 domain-containing protein [Actinomycetota bacterium]
MRSSISPTDQRARHADLFHPATADWYADPLGQHHLRFFDGRQWTDAVTHFGPVPCRGCSDRRQT